MATKDIRSPDYTYIVAEFKGNISNRRITGDLINLQPHTGPRPKSYTDFGADITSLRRIDSRTKGSFHTLVRLGFGLAIFIQDVFKLIWPEQHLMEKIFRQYGEFGPEAFVGVFRDLWAPGSRLCVDTFNGVPSDLHLIHKGGLYLEALHQGSEEFGFYNDSGYVLPNARDASQQEIIRSTQKKAWGRNVSETVAAYAATLERKTVVYDYIGDEDVVIAMEPHNGGMDIIFPVTLSLPNNRFYVRDLERKLHPVTMSIPPRNIQIICVRKNKSPLAFTFFRSEGLKITSPVISIAGEMKKTFLNSKTRNVMMAVRWIS